MITETYRDGILVERRDDTARTVTTYGPTGQVTETRPYTAQENADADARDAASAVQDVARVRAELADAILTATAALMEDAHADGETWTQPTGAHDAYPLVVTVVHNNKTWTNLVPANVWVPGVSGWREVVAEGPAAWVQPTGGHDAYPLGAQVTHAGKTWTSTVAANVWEPGVYGWV